MYLYIFGTFRSFDVRKVGYIKVLFYVLIGTIATPFKIAIEILAVLWGITSPKHKFFIVQKDLVQEV